MDLTGLSGYLPSLLILIAGVIVCGYGYRFFRLSVTLIGAAVGFAIGNLVASSVLVIPALFWVIVGVFTVGLGSVACAFYEKAIIIICTVGIAYWYVNGYADSSIRNWLIGLGIGLVVGLAAFFLQKAAIMLVTAVAGAKMITTVALPYIFMIPFMSGLSDKIGEFVFKDTKLPPEVFVPGVLLLIIASCGFVKQLKEDKK
jgi:hypothetical protein